MTKTSKCAWSCKDAGGAFPVVATFTGVASCFAEALLKKHTGLGSASELLLLTGQVVPLAFVLRYLASRSRRRTQRRVPAAHSI